MANPLVSSNAARPVSADIGSSFVLTRDNPTPAPSDLNPAQAVVWRQVTSTLPTDWFPPESLPLLTQYCRHVVSANNLAALIDGLEAGGNIDLSDYRQLLDMQIRNTNAIGILSNRMRLSQQSTINHRGNRIKGGANEATKPWETVE